MNYRCPQCSQRLNLRSLFFHDISTCSHCGQKVVLGDFLAFSMAAVTMLVSALTALYVLNEELQQYFVAAGYALSIGMGAGVIVLLLLGRATPFRRGRVRRHEPPAASA
jgi:DNA-directed RNA polymerase subunit RPC12/RpoP